jgi:hypothetical protein
VCPLCNRSFQRADVKALHAKKCQGVTTSDQSAGAGSHAGSPRKRVRLACNRCRQKKVACNGQEPCSQCRNVPHECEYAGPRDLPDTGLDSTGIDERRQSFVGDDGFSASSIALRSDSAGVSPSQNSFGLAPNAHSVGFLPMLDKTTPMAVPEQVVNDGLDVSLDPGDLLDPMSMNDMWQMPALVRVETSQV